MTKKMELETYNIDLTLDIYSLQITGYELKCVIEEAVRKISVGTTTPVRVGITRVTNVTEKAGESE